MNRIKLLREELNMTQQELADKIDGAKSTVAMYEKGDRKPSMEILIKLSEIFQCSIDYLLCKSDIRNPEENLNNNLKDKLFIIPIVGRVAAGKPLLAEENLEGYLPIDPNIYGMTVPENYFFLRVSGNSMNKLIKNGAYALIQKQDFAEDGDVVVAIVNGDDEATLKRFKRLNEQFVLLEPVSDDSSYQSITVDLKNTSFKIIGKAIGDFKKW